ncbi:hypothetical protein ACTJIJ_06435 [Niabella sp. 22666]|uniref:hypothetical protein n=1 Tax=Niabella sp. 22666 TaxID=3453954 RepID=UPI003F86AF82
MLTPIKSEQQYEDALERVYMLMQTEVTAGLKAYDEWELISIRTKEYKHENHPVPQPNPPGAIRFRMGQLNTSEAEFI